VLHVRVDGDRRHHVATTFDGVTDARIRDRTLADPRVPPYDATLSLARRPAGSPREGDDRRRDRSHEPTRHAVPPFPRGVALRSTERRRTAVRLRRWASRAGSSRNDDAPSPVPCRGVGARSTAGGDGRPAVGHGTRPRPARARIRCHRGASSQPAVLDRVR
jgi:hypothetical protein